MNQLAAVWLVWLPPNQTVIWRWIRESWALGQTLLLWSDRERLITTEWPQWLQMSNCPTTTPPRFSPQYFPEVHKSCIFLFFADADKKNCKFMRMMLMSVSSILMTLQINWALIEVPLSICRVFFLSGQVLQRPLPKRSQQPVKASPLHSHTKRAFSPWILNRRACRIFLSYWRKTFSGVCGVQLDCLCSFGKNGRLITCSAAWLRFSNQRQLKKALPASILVAVVISLCFYWPNWRDWQEAHGK